MKTVVILGAGISGLIAAWALEQLGRPFIIVDRGPRGALPRLAKGCVYFHDRCDLPANMIRRQTLMTQVLPYTEDSMTSAELYHRKVWGDRPYVRNSIEALVERRYEYSDVYSMNDALTYLTDRYSESIVIQNALTDDVMKWAMNQRIISTLPFPMLAPSARCESTPLYIFQGATSASPDPDFGDRGYVLYNVDPKTLWYRMANMFGYFSMEFVRPPIGWTLERYVKIITSPDVELFMKENPNIHLTGRWGRWQRGRLGHETYKEVKELFTTGRWA